MAQDIKGSSFKTASGDAVRGMMIMSVDANGIAVPVGTSAGITGTAAPSVLGDLIPGIVLMAVDANGAPTQISAGVSAGGGGGGGGTSSGEPADLTSINLGAAYLSADGDFTPTVNRILAAAPAGAVKIRMPAGTYTFASPITVSGRTLIVEGVPGATIISVSHAGTWLTCNPSSVDQQVIVSGITAYSTSATGTAAFMKVTYPTSTVVTHPSLHVFNCEIRSTVDGNLPGTWLKGFVLSNVWISRIHDVTMQGRFLVPGTANSCLLDISECIDIFVDACELTYGDTLVYQTGYCEGLRISRSSAIGSNLLLKQNLASITRRSSYTMIGLWLTGNEINTQAGGIVADSIKDAIISANEWSQWAGVAANTTWAVYRLTNCQSFNASSDVWVGGATPASCTGVILRLTGASCSFNVWTGVTCENGVGIAADFGAGTALNSIVEMRKADATTLTDAGVGNSITWRTQVGSLASIGGHVLAGAGGQSLMLIPNVANAVNILMLSAATTGNAPSLQPFGSDADIALVLSPKGAGQLYATAHINGVSGAFPAGLTSGGSTVVTVATATAPSTTTPAANGTAAVGTATTYARADHVHPTDTTLAPKLSPALTGTPTSTTAAANTSTTQIATCGFVVGQAATVAPLAGAGTALVGTSLLYARQDHVHPTPTIALGGTGATSASAARVNINQGTLALTSGASVATAATNNVFTLTLATNAVLANPTGMVAGASYAWIITQDATGGRTLSYGTLFKFAGGVAPTLSTAAGAIDVLTAIYNGTVLVASLAKGFA